MKKEKEKEKENPKLAAKMNYLAAIVLFAAAVIGYARGSGYASMCFIQGGICLCSGAAASKKSKGG